MSKAGFHRPDGALLAGVCSGIAAALGWNVWALRALFVVFLLAKTLWAVVAYGLLAILLQLVGWQRRHAGVPPGGLESPELAERSRRIAELEKRFREL